jgi:hypothetical protein
MNSVKAERILFRLRTMEKNFYLQLCAMPPGVKFKSKIFFPSPRYAAQRGVDFGLSCIAGSHDSALCGIALSQFLQLNLIEFLRKF